MELKGSKTEANLWKAFAGESQARNKYDYFASQAKKDGYEQIAAIFQETALNEKEHAKLWFKAVSYTHLSPQPVPDWADYWIGSVHNLRDPRTGAYHCVDWDREKLASCRDEMFRGDALAMAEGYYADVAAMAARHPTILGHIDLVTKFNEPAAFFDEAAPRYRAAALAALEAADPVRTLLEVNTGAVSRGYRTVPYPAQFLLRAWRERGGDIILTADSHRTDTVAWGYRQAADWARAAGYTRCVVLTLSGREICPL